MSRWLTWEPHQIFRDSPKRVPSKPTKPRFDGFVGSISGNSQKIETGNAATVETPAVDSWEWIEERAAIMELEGGPDRHAANHTTFLRWYWQFVEKE